MEVYRSGEPAVFVDHKENVQRKSNGSAGGLKAKSVKLGSKKSTTAKPATSVRRALGDISNNRLNSANTNTKGTLKTTTTSKRGAGLGAKPSHPRAGVYIDPSPKLLTVDPSTENESDDDVEFDTCNRRATCSSPPVQCDLNVFSILTQQNQIVSKSRADGLMEAFAAPSKAYKTGISMMRKQKDTKLKNKVSFVFANEDEESDEDEWLRSELPQGSDMESLLRGPESDEQEDDLAFLLDF